MAVTAGMVLAAGLGTRLRPLTQLMPKPAVPVLGLPVLSHALWSLADAGLTRAAVNTHHQAEQLAALVRAHPAEGLEVQLSHEPEILGTAGGLGRALPLLGDPDQVILVNGDSIWDVDLAAVIREHERRGADATLVVRHKADLRRFSPVELDEAGCVVRLAGHPAVPPRPTTGRVLFAGIHVLGRRVLEAIPRGPSDINHEVYPALILEGAELHVVDHPGFWHDLGTPRRLLEANLDALVQRPPRLVQRSLKLGRLSDPQDRGVCFAAEGVELEDSAELISSVMTPGVSVSARAHVRHSLLLGPSTVGPDAVLERSILGPGAGVAQGERLHDCLRVAGHPDRRLEDAA